MSFSQGAPTQPLSLVASNVFLTGNSTAGNAFTVQQLSAGNVISAVTSTGSTALIVTGGGNVGIGITNPSYPFHVSSAATTTQVVAAFLQPSSGTSGVYTQMVLGGATGTSQCAYLGFANYGANTSNLLSISLAGQGGSQICITNAGVGIGKTNPSYALDVTGDLNFTGTFRQNGTPYIGSQWTGTTSLYFVGNVGIGTNNPQYRLHVTNPGPVANIIIETDTNAIGQRSEIRFGIPAFSGTAYRAAVTSNTYVSNGSDLQFWTNASSGTGSVPQMTILPSGNVGISRSDPGTTFDVLGTNRTQILANAAGNPGIASYALSINQYNAGNTEVAGEATGIAFNRAAKDVSHVGAKILFISDGTGYGRGDLSFQLKQAAANGDSSVEIMRLKESNGSVGIGTNNPGDLLHVYSSAGSQIRVDGGSGGSGDP